MSRAHTRVYGKTCDRCGAAITVRAGDPQLCGRHRADEGRV